MTTAEALAFVAEHGVVLEAARGPVPTLAEAIVGAPLHGSWWGHPLGHTIYEIIHAVRGDAEVLVCRLVGGKVTYVHRRLWPALARLAPELHSRWASAVEEMHTTSGMHQVIETPIQEWLPGQIQEAGRRLTREEAIDALGEWMGSMLEATEAPRPQRRARKSRKRYPALP